tara:strand:- start:244 stop:795 length:552 start_codon:yes stop_codon:yes gene_type:complete
MCGGAVRKENSKVITNSELTVKIVGALAANPGIFGQRFGVHGNVSSVVAVTVAQSTPFQSTPLAVSGDVESVANALVPIEVTVDANFTETRAAALKKASLSIVARLVAGLISSDAREPISLNAPSLIVVRLVPDSKVTKVTPAHILNAPALISTTLLSMTIIFAEPQQWTPSLYTHDVELEYL